MSIISSPKGISEPRYPQNPLLNSTKNVLPAFPFFLVEGSLHNFEDLTCQRCKLTLCFLAMQKSRNPFSCRAQYSRFIFRLIFLTVCQPLPLLYLLTNFAFTELPSSYLISDNLGSPKVSSRCLCSLKEFF